MSRMLWMRLFHIYFLFERCMVILLLKLFRLDRLYNRLDQVNYELSILEWYLRGDSDA